MRKFSLAASALLLATTALMAADAPTNEQLMDELNALKAQLNELKATVKKTNVEGINKELSAIKKQTGGNHLKFDADYRFSYDNINYKMADGSKQKNNDLLTNRLWIGAKYAPTDSISFISKLSYLKAFGDSANHQQANTNPGYADFDWVTNENALDGTLHVKEMYAIYFGNIANTVPITASIGRRPSTEGYPANLREDDSPNSPLAHLINVEFDGASFKFSLDKLTGVSGMYIKACLGRGLTNAKRRFYPDGTDYSKNDTLNKDVDMYGFIFVPYDDGQYALQTEFVWAQNLIGYSASDLYNYNMASQGFDPTTSNPAQGIYTPLPGDPRTYGSYVQYYAPQFKSVGGYQGGNIIASVKGIGNFWSDFLDDTTVFLSYAYSQTDPQYGQVMLGSPDKKFGSSWYAGVQMPDPFMYGKVGVEYNQGSKYWRSMTYAEDTMIGSKLAARGSAWEAYYTFPIIGKILTGQLRYTYIDYDYTGSNSFFGAEGAPIKISDDAALAAAGYNKSQVVDNASDIRFYLRYRY